MRLVYWQLIKHIEVMNEIHASYKFLNPDLDFRSVSISLDSQTLEHEHAFHTHV